MSGRWEEIVSGKTGWLTAAGRRSPRGSKGSAGGKKGKARKGRKGDSSASSHALIDQAEREHLYPDLYLADPDRVSNPTQIANLLVRLYARSKKNPKRRGVQVKNISKAAFFSIQPKGAKKPIEGEFSVLTVTAIQRIKYIQRHLVDWADERARERFRLSKAEEKKVLDLALKEKVAKAAEITAKSLGKKRASPKIKKSVAKITRPLTKRETVSAVKQAEREKKERVDEKQSLKRAAKLKGRKLTPKQKEERERAMERALQDLLIAEVRKAAPKIKPAEAERVAKKLSKDKRRWPTGVPRLDQLEGDATSISEVYKLGRPLKKKDKDSRVGTSDYVGKFMDLEKLSVDIVDPRKGKPMAVPIHPTDPRKTLVPLKEFMRPYLERFVADMMNKSENAYILRIKTASRLASGKVTKEGVGTERFKLRRKLQLEERQFYPKGLSDREILRRIQMAEIEKYLDMLFTRFGEKYETYMSRKAVESIAIRGFSLEVVKSLSK